MKFSKMIVLAAFVATCANGQEGRFGFDRGGFDVEQPMVITADRIEFDNKEKVAIFDGQVKVAHSQFNLTAEQVFVFIDDANELRNILAQGAVVMTNENLRASCDWALYTRAEGTLVMRAGEEGNIAQIMRGADSTEGYQITLWLEDERIEAVKSPDSTSRATFTISPGTLRPGGAKKEAPEEKPEEEKTEEPEKPAPVKPSLYTDPEAQAE